MKVKILFGVLFIMFIAGMFNDKPWIFYRYENDKAEYLQTTDKEIINESIDKFIESKEPVKVSQNFDEKVLELLSDAEDFRSCPYYDRGGVATIGFGSTYMPNGDKVKITDKCITKQYARDIKIYHVKNRTIPRIKRHCNYDLMSENQKLSSILHTYNTGKSPCVNKKYSIAKVSESTRDRTGKESLGLQRRRMEEILLAVSYPIEGE